MTDTKTTHPAPPGPLGEHEARLGDRGDASGRNIEQNRAVGQDDPLHGSRMGRRLYDGTGQPGIPDIGTDATQLEEAERERTSREAKR
ncbi:hypothetical protein H4CHR_05864 [Variovorax sp. PBS-H4]|nr:hypothetical protein H4CHR_05864 [Variovorax sp. PBS-H4]